MEIQIMNTTNFTEEQVKEWVYEQFGLEGIVVTQISDRHYSNRKLPYGQKILDVQIGYLRPSKRKSANVRIKDIKNLTLILDEE